VFSHNDLGIEHVLGTPATAAVTGVIDWGDAALIDPACDFGLLYRDLGAAALPTRRACGEFGQGDPVVAAEPVIGGQPGQPGRPTPPPHY